MNRRRVGFILLTVTFSSLLALVVAEDLLRMQTASISQSESMEPGLIGYDRRLGWRLQKNWRGTHRHHDFSVSYQINRRGFRGPWSTDQRRSRLVLVGDSFTFGLGVKDDDTFARQLQRQCSDDQIDVVNLGVPGYSTDQELLLIEDRIEELKPTQIIMVVCLINDLFDNERTFPLQARHGKPRFTLDDSDELLLTNVPVPTTEKPQSEQSDNLASLVMGELDVKQNAVARWLGRREIVRRLGWFQPEFSAPKGYFDERFRSPLALFEALLARGREVVESAGTRFQLALLPGRSCVELEGGYSAQYQDFLRQKIGEQARRQEIEVLDLTDPLRNAYRLNSLPLYHPHDGHLNARGHQLVASLLRQTMRNADKKSANYIQSPTSDAKTR